MQIKTAAILIAGIGIGWIFFREPDKKEKTIYILKKHLYKAQTGKEYPKKCSFKNPSFESIKEAKEFVNAIKPIIEEYGLISINDVLYFSNRHDVSAITYEMAKYGWLKKDLIDYLKIDMDPLSNKYIVNFPIPHLIY